MAGSDYSRGACVGKNPAWWSIEPSDYKLLSRPQRRELRTIEAKAKTLCRGCPIRQRCLRESLDPFEGGLRGGYTEKERLRMRPADARLPTYLSAQPKSRLDR